MSKAKCSCSTEYGVESRLDCPVHGIPDEPEQAIYVRSDCKSDDCDNIACVRHGAVR